jgi:hypothetical protein
VNTSTLRSFGGESEARGFAGFFQAFTGAAAKTAPFEHHDGTLSETWFTVTVPARLQKRAEDLRAAWDARHAWDSDQRDAERASAYTDEDVARVLKGSVFEIGIAAPLRAFLASAAKGAADPWDHPSSAVASAKRFGWVLAVKAKSGGTRYSLTADGAAALATTERKSA